MASYRSVDLVIAALILILVSRLWTTRSKRKSYPPGPKGWPILGNIFDVPRSLSYKKFAELSKDLESGVIYLDAAGTPFVVLNSLEAATDLLDKRSAIYSSRFHTTMSYDLLDGKRLFPLIPNNDKWKEERRLMTKWLTSTDQNLIHTRLRDAVRKILIPNLLSTPQDFLTHIRNGVGGAIIPITYGLQIRRVNDPWVQLAEDAMQCLTSATVPGRYLVDVLPFLKYVPEWIPGAGFRKEAREGCELMKCFLELPFQAAKKSMAECTAEPSFVTDMLNELEVEGETREAKIENTAGAFFAGGADTTTSAIKAFVVAMLLHPTAQRKAQAEIDMVIGKTRMPDFHDKPDLPYLGAVLKEVFRWQPMLPIGFPHLSTQDDTYRGYLIPKGSIVIGNVWAMLRDERYFPNPEEFNPDRFMDERGKLRTDIPDTEKVASFGFGRRSCPGSQIGLPGFWLAAACFLACFDILPALNGCGDEVEPTVEYAGETVVAHPDPFQCRFVPRSKDVIDLIRAESDGGSEYI